MSITIATKNRRYVVKMEDADSNRAFKDIVRLLLDREDADTDLMPYQVVEEPEPAPEPELSEVPAADFDTQELPSDPDEDEYPIPATEPEQKRGYSGFLYIKCPECGEARAFCSKYELTFYKCPDCGTKTPLDNMTPLYINCECGGRSRYLTNEDEFAFDVNCIECGSPVAVKYNRRKKIYETIQ